jgi:hypothetical protein
MLQAPVYSPPCRGTILAPDSSPIADDKPMVLTGMLVGNAHHTIGIFRLTIFAYPTWLFWLK